MTETQIQPQPQAQPEYSLRQARNEIEKAYQVALIAHPSQRYGFFLRSLTKESLWVLCNLKDDAPDLIQLAFFTTQRAGNLLHDRKYSRNIDALRLAAVQLIRDCQGELFQRLELCEYSPAPDPFVPGCRATVRLTEQGHAFQGPGRKALERLLSDSEPMAESTPASEEASGPEEPERATA